jgi:ABC-type glycerol-3-phosphate transport system permease component
MKRPLAVAVQQALMILLALISLYPLWFAAQTALKTPESFSLDPTGLPNEPTLKNFFDLFSVMPFGLWTLNSTMVVLASVVGATVISMLAAYAIVFGRFTGRLLFLNINIVLIALPTVALVVPLFTSMLQLGLIDTLWSVIIIYTGLLVPFSTFFLVNFFRELPVEIVEAAVIDGASHLEILWRIIAPVSLAGVLTLVTINSIWVWNEVLFALVFLQDNKRRTVMAGLALLRGRYSTNEPLTMAGAVLSMLPLLLVYLASQKFFVRGMTTGLGK